MKIYGLKFSLVFVIMAISATLTACQKKPESNTTSTKSSISSTLVGCYTTMKTEPAQIKINLDNNKYTMQMREFNDPNKPWDKPEPLQELAKTDYKIYFGVDEKSVEKALIRPDSVFALAKVQDASLNLDSRFDSNYLGYIAKAENMKGNSATVYQVDCGK